MQHEKIPKGHKRDGSSASTPSRQAHIKETVNQEKKKPSGLTSKPTTPKNHRRTPNRTTVKYGISNSAPVQQKVGGKRMEPNLFENFLLGRTGSPRFQRTAPLRRVSLEMIKADMKSEFVSKLKEPGKVKDRVRQWQMSSAVVEGTIKTEEGMRQNSKAENQGGLIQMAESKIFRPRISEKITSSSKEKPKSSDREAVRQQTAIPKKCVRNDSHWLKRDKKNIPTKRESLSKHLRSAKAVNCPLENKIHDWIGRTEFNGFGDMEKLKIKDLQEIDSTQHKLDDSGEVFTAHLTSRSSKIETTVFNPLNDIIKVKNEFLENNANDDIRGRPIHGKISNLGQEYRPRTDLDDIKSQKLNEKDETFVKNTKSNILKTSVSVHKTQPLDTESGSKTPKKSEQISNTNKLGKSSNQEAHNGPKMVKIKKIYTSDEDKDVNKLIPASQNRRDEILRKRSKARSTSLNEIPFGNSAFSVLDLPLGAEAGTIRKSSTKRNSSLTVPNVLKLVYSGSKKIVNDATEPRRSDLTYPASIESWLKTTSDPFVDSPLMPNTANENSTHLDRNTSSTKIRNIDSKASSICREPTQHTKDQKPNIGRNVVPVPKNSSKSSESSPLRSVPSTELKRSRAKRHTFNVSSNRVVPIKESIFNAFHGESTMKKSSRAKNFDPISYKEKNIGAPNSDIKTLSPNTMSEPSNPPNQKPTEELTSEPSLDKLETLITQPQRSTWTPYTHELSTIISEASSNSLSLGSDSESNNFQNTVTQDTTHSLVTSSSLSPKSQQKQLKSPELKRRLTKHSDLISILSLSDSSEHGRYGNIRKARSVRTTRKHNHISSIEDVLIDLAGDELQYMRELETLIDGVIPVLLRCIFSESKSSRLFGNLVTNTASFSRPIIEMGNALVKIQSHHKCIPLADAYALLIWIDAAQAFYEEYLNTWNSGFEDIVVNLTPVLSCSKTAMDEMRRDQNGDLLGEKGEKIVVADLLKKPINRIKHIHRALKNLNDFPTTSEEAKRICSSYENLLNLRKNRIKEENARKVDRQAWSANTSRARNLKSLDSAGLLEINHHYQVIAKDCFSFEMLHSTGQRINCSVELVLRTLPNSAEEGDLLIFKDDSRDPFLLFEPISKSLLSARLGDTEEQVIVMVNDNVLGSNYAQFLILDAATKRIAADWISMLGDQPIPPPIIRAKLKINPVLEPAFSSEEMNGTSAVKLLNEKDSDQVPIGERASEELLSLTLSKKTNPQEKYLQETRDPSETLKKLIDIKEFDSNDEGDILSVTAPNSWSSRGGQSSNSSNLSTKINLQIEEITKSINETIISKSCSDIEKKFIDSSDERITQGFRDDGAPEPPVHRSPVSCTVGSSTALDVVAFRGKTQLISSPLKYEYQPSVSSDSFSEESSDTDSCISSLAEDLSDNELEDKESEKQPELQSKYSTHLNITTNLSENIIRDSLPTPQFPAPLDLKESFECPSEQFFAVLSQWNGLVGKWITLNNETLVQVMDGLIECFHGHTSVGIKTAKGAEDKRSFLKQTLTSEVQVRQSTAIDIEIKSAISFTNDCPVSVSPFEAGNTLRYRLSTPSSCDAFYAAVHRSRIRSNVYLEIEEHANIKKAKSQLHNKAVATSRRRNLFGIGRKKSYRASTRINDNQNSREVGKLNMAMTALQRLSGAAGLFNISRSWVEYGYRDNNSSYGGSSYQNNYTPPRTPGSLAGNSDSLHSSGLTVRNLGTSNILTRLYYLLRNGNWLDQGQAFLTVSVPPPDMKQKAPLYNGPQKRITVTKSPIPVSEVVTSADIQKSGLMLDEVLGANLFVRMQKIGIMLQTWEDVSGKEGQGGVRSFGSVAPKRHTWALQFRRSGDTEWCWQLCRSGIP